MINNISEINEIENKIINLKSITLDDLLKIVSSIKVLLTIHTEAKIKQNDNYIMLVDFVKESSICKTLNLTPDRISFHLRKDPDLFKGIFATRMIGKKMRYFVDAPLLEQKLEKVKWKGKCEKEILKKYLQEKETNLHG